MRCPFCAEVIQDQAVLCRFCGARKAGPDWQPPAAGAAGAAAPPGALTLRSAGAFLILSAALELISPLGEVPLFGAVRGGAVAFVYHAVFAAAYLAMGVSLVTLRRSAYAAVMAGTALYTLDKLLWFVDRAAQDAYFNQQLAGADALVPIEDVRRLALLTGLGMLVSWWGFAAYLHYRRASLGGGAPPPAPVTG